MLTTVLASCPANVPDEMACVPAGEFLRGRDRGGWKNERPQATIDLDAFLIDRYEVTSADYKACIKEGACPKQGPNYRGFSRPKQPVVGVSWYGALAYCQWRQKRLPTEAEWEKAARGTDGRRYPWGQAKATCKLAVILDPKRSQENGCGRGKTWAVGSFKPNPYGLYDMAGNSWEWVADWYSESYATCGKDCLGKNPKGPCAGAESCPGHDKKIVRGGSWYWDASHATTTRRRPHTPKNRPFHHFGFRCARSLMTADASPAAGPAVEESP